MGKEGQHQTQILQQTGKLDQLTRQSATLATTTITVQEDRMITSLDTGITKNDDGEFKLNKAKSWGRRPTYLASGKMCDRIIKVYFTENPMVAIIVAYTPTEAATADSKE